MATVKKKVSLYETPEGMAIVEALIIMSKDVAYNTGSSYSANVSLYPDHKIPFVDKHVQYLNLHPNIDPQQYLSNLRLMTRSKSRI
jgi:hypothetical protein